MRPGVLQTGVGVRVGAGVGVAEGVMVGAGVRVAVGVWVVVGDAGKGVDASAARVGMAGVAGKQATRVANAMMTGRQMSRKSGFARFKIEPV